MVNRRICVVDDEASVRAMLRVWLEREGYSVTECVHGQDLLDRVHECAPEVILLDMEMPTKDGLQTFIELKKRHRRPPPVILISGRELVETAVQAMRLGAFDYQLKPVHKERVLTNVTNALRQYDLEQRIRQLESASQGRPMVGASVSMRQLQNQIDRVAEATIPVLIHGESGTGKELVARAIHDRGQRSQGPFVAINCAAISETLLESELFGHEKGAFTGAIAQHKGTFERAHGGTLFLDEIGEISLPVQAKLLRVLQEGVVTRLGGTQTISVDVRVVSATNKNLDELIEKKLFRDDLYYRLVVDTLTVPSLRDRRDDIPLLIQHFLNAHAPSRAWRGVAPDALSTLMDYRWPGNVRELENVVRRAIVASDGDILNSAALPAKLTSEHANGRAIVSTAGSPANADTQQSSMTLRELEKNAILSAMQRLAGNQSLVAKELDIGRTTLYRRLIEYGVLPPVTNEKSSR